MDFLGIDLVYIRVCISLDSLNLSIDPNHAQDNSVIILLTLLIHSLMLLSFSI